METQTYEKNVTIASLVDKNGFSESTSTISQLINLTNYICGTQISASQEDGILQLVYKANCYDSVLGGEAAIKSAEYVNKIVSYFETAYKALFTIILTVPIIQRKKL